jgi:hypothetical protein
MQLPLTGQPQRQLTILADVTIDEVLQRCRHAAPFKTKAAQQAFSEQSRAIHAYATLAVTARGYRTGLGLGLAFLA